MRTIYLIKLDGHDLGQLLDGLEVRANAWEKTAIYHRTGESPTDILVEECADAKEAEKIAAHYRIIIGKIEKQMEAQS